MMFYWERKEISSIELSNLKINFQIQNFQPSEKLFKKYTAKICLEKFEGLQGFGGNVTNRMVETERRAENERYCMHFS